MKLKIFVEDNVVSIDGVATDVDLTGLIDPEIHVVQWEDVAGHIEYKDHFKENEDIQDITGFQAIVDAYYAAIDKQKQTEAAIAAARANLSYKDRRKAEYPAVEDQLEAIWDILAAPAGSEAEIIKNQISAIKTKYPKPAGG